MSGAKKLDTACPRPRKRPRKPKSGIPRKTRINKVNRKRQRREFQRAYGSRKRVRFVQSLPCLVEGCTRYPLARQVVHIDTGGTGRKADASHTVPLCFHHHIEVLHRIGRETFEERYGLDLTAAAANTEKLWINSKTGDTE